MNRRTLLQGFVAGTAGLVLPPGLQENAGAVTRASLRAKIAQGIVELEEEYRRSWPGYGPGRWGSPAVLTTPVVHEWETDWFDAGMRFDLVPRCVRVYLIDGQIIDYPIRETADGRWHADVTYPQDKVSIVYNKVPQPSLARPMRIPS